MSFSTVRYDVADGVAVVTLDRPERLNAFTPQMAEEFIAALDLADADDVVRAVIVTGAGRAFSAGADLSSGAAAFDLEAETLQRDLGGLMTLRLFECAKPTIAAVNGPAVGVGATLQLAMDVRIAAREARYGFVFVRRGLVPEAASSWFLPRIVGIATALDWCLAGRMVSAEEALAAGLVSRVTDAETLMVEAHAVARSFAEGTAPVSVALTRRMLWTMLGAPHPMDGHVLDSLALRSRAAAADLEEGIAAFMDKRPPAFPDRVSEGLPDVFPPWSRRTFP